MINFLFPSDQRNLVKIEILPIRQLVYGSAGGAGAEGAHTTWPIAVGSAPAGRRAVVMARRLFIPYTLDIAGIQWTNDGAASVITRARRAKFALFNADGNTGHWRGTLGVDTGMPSTVRTGRMDQSILFGDANTSGTAENLYRGGTDGNTRGMRYLFDQVDRVSAGTWIWVLGCMELCYTVTDSSAGNVFPVPSGTAPEILTPHQQGGGSANARNLVWADEIGNGTNAALASTDTAGVAWSVFEHATTKWVNQTNTTPYALNNPAGGTQDVNMGCRDFYGHLVLNS